MNDDQEGKYMVNWIKGLLVTAAIATALSIRFFFPGLPQDNPVEEAAEYVIEQETGLSVDLTPESPEKK